VNLAKGLNFKSLGSIYARAANGLNWSNANASADGTPARGIYTNFIYLDILSENTLNYDKNFGNHGINLLGGFTYQRTDDERGQVTGVGYPSNEIRTLNNANAVDKSATFGTKVQIGLLSYLGRISYNFNSKYLLSASVRADGSSYFGPGNKWGTFPSVSVGWVVSDEKFMKAVNAISLLKLRASYGATGNNRILDFGYLNLLNAADYSFGSGNGNSLLGQAINPNILGNSDLTWERTFQTNFGADLSLFATRLNVSLDVYDSKTEKLLLQQSALAISGVPQFWNNNGRLQNRGIELEVNSVNVNSRKFRWSTQANISRNQNKLLELGEEKFLLNQGERTEIYRNNVGDPLIQFFGYKTDGVWLSQQEILDAQAKGLKSEISNVFVPGGLKLVDINNDNIINSDDRTVIGNPYPDFTWGLTNNFNYKGFDLSFTLQGVQGGDIINGDANYNESRRTIRAFTNNRWVSPKFPGDSRTPYSTVGFNWMLTDYVVEDASYYTIREVIFGYTLPSKLLKKLKMGTARIFVSGQNLYFHTAKNFRGLNPEARSEFGPYRSTLIDGYMRGGFPIPKTYAAGIDINF
jgi:TonB-linked SusC/RagA family outer membrane protein